MKEKKREKKNRSMKQYKGASLPWSLGMAFLTSLLLTVFASLLVIYFTVGSEEYMKQSAEDGEFGAHVYQMLSENYTSYSAASGFDKEVLLGPVSPERINEDIKASIDEIYNGDGKLDSREKVKEEIYNAMEADAVRQGVEVTDSVKEALQMTAEYCRYDYMKYVAIPLASQISVIVHKLDRVLWIGVLLMALFTLAALFLTFRLAGGGGIGLRFLSYSFITATILNFVFANVIYPMLKLDQLSLNPASVKRFVLCYVEGLFQMFNTVGLVFAAISIILIGFSVLMPRIRRLSNIRY